LNARDDFSKHTLDILAKRVGVRCSNPACRKLTTRPRTDSTRIVNIGVEAHIAAASPGGPRFDPTLSTADRQAEENGIWLCQNCAKLVDNDPVRYSVEVLRHWKQRAEGAALSEIEGDTSATLRPESSAEIEISYEEVVIRSQRHDYRLLIKLRNLGTEPLGTYHVDLEMPARAIERPWENILYVPDRSSQTLSFFRVTDKHGVGEIYPGDTKVAMSIAYYMDAKMYFGRGNLFAQSVRATLYQPRFQPLVVEKKFYDLQVF
jgi:hypothetical protein